MRPSRSPSSLNPSSPSNNAQRRGREADGGSDTSQGSNFKVVIRVRPPLPRELEGDKPFQNVVKVSRDERAITISENVNATDEDGNPTYGNGPYSTHRFTFDTVYGQNSTQEKVYNTTARAVVDSSLQGYNATIFAYGQTGTGKTYTMEGFHQHDQRGIIPRAIEQIFNHISSSVSPRLRFLVRASYLQIYNEVISDLLKPERTNLAIREAKKRGVFVEGLSEWVVRSPEEIYGLMERGGAMRATGSTKMNELSSRSHAVFIIIAEQSETTYVDSSGNELAPEDFHELVKTTKTQSDLNALEKDVRQSFKVGKLNLVDLAGSERVRLSGATGQRLEESKKINQSLSALGNVIAALTDPRGRQHIPYRDSKLTRILEDSLGGNCKTTMMAMVSPALEAILESVSTLKFANRAKNIKNLATINEDMDQRSLLRKYERELKRLRAELENRTKTVVDKRRLLELDEQRRRAEQDKMAAIRALEKRSLEFMREKQEKKRLESKINSLQGQMLMGGLEKNIVATPAFRAALKEQRDTIREEYEKRLADLEMERETIEEEKAQVDRYKQLLLKQRDIMIALTQRLNERDEQIMALQDELDAYDRHQKELEEKLDEKTAALIHLQRVTMEHNANSPIKNADLDEALGGWAPPGQQQRQQQQQQQQQHFQKQGGGSSEGNGGGSGSNGSNGSNRSMNNSSGGGGPLSTMASPGGNGKEGRRQAAEARRAAGTSTGGAHKAAVPQKQYEPYNDATVFVGSAVSAQPGEEQRMLSADEKIRELAMIVDKQKSDQQKLSRELEEVQAEKVSMEYLLREKLEKLVQSEIEARLHMYRRDDRESALTQRPMAQMKTELDNSKEELRRVVEERKQAGEEVRLLRDKLQKLSTQNIDNNSSNNNNNNNNKTPPSTPRGLELKSRLDSLNRQHESFRQEMATRMENKNRAMQQMQKERRAIQTIMERKIKTLTDNIAAALAAITKMSTNGGAPLNDLNNSNAAHTQRLSREVLALQRLVNAAITALRNAETENA